MPKLKYSLCQVHNKKSTYNKSIYKGVEGGMCPPGKRKV